MNSGLRFTPVQCTEATFNRMGATNGYVYFITDKKKIYLGKDGEKIPMCASSGIFYGSKPIEYDNSGTLPDPNVSFLFDEIEGEDIPEIDDLILNIGTSNLPDGCFYRVKKIDDVIETVRLTLQGTGGGSNIPGDTPSTNVNFSISVNKSFTYGSEDSEMLFSFKGNYQSNDGNTISRIAFTLRGEEEPFYSVDRNFEFNKEHSISLNNYKHLFNTVSATKVKFQVYDLYGNERSTTVDIRLVSLQLSKTRNDLLYTKEDNYIYACKVVGTTSSEKKITYTIFSENNLYKPLKTMEQTLDSYVEDEVQYSLNLEDLSHGIYILKVQATTYTNGKLITSNTLTHKLGKIALNSNEPLLMVALPEKMEQHTNIPIQYMIVSNDSNQDYTLNISINDNTKVELTTKVNVVGEYNLYFDVAGAYALRIVLIEMNLIHSETIVITKYTGQLPIIDPERSDLMLYLNPRNKSNDATDKNIWMDYNKKYIGNLYDFHYGSANGWFLDNDNVNYLKLTSGANFIMSDFKPFSKDPTRLDQNDSKMGYGMTIELDFEIDGILNYQSELIKCLSRTLEGKAQVGFTVTGDRISLYGGGSKLLSLNLVEGKRTKISFVIEPNTGSIEFPMVYGYINGKLSGAVFHEGASFKEISTNPAILNINSKEAQIKIYGIRFYSSALSDRVILNNYTSTLSTLDEKQQAFDSNNVYDTSGKINYLKVASDEYNLQIPYMKITGGWATVSKDKKWQLRGQSNANAGLPKGKEDYRLIDVEVKYPNNSLFTNYKDYKFVNVFENDLTMSQAYDKKPLNGGAIMYAQGTSSMEYPVKNLRIRFKNEEDWFKVRPDIANVEIICMKADYMESSGSHNTGAANLVDELYESVGLATPGQRHFGPNENNPDRDTIVTCIKGHPCLIFYSESGEPGSYEYIGKYNLNLDKATPEPFGFNHDDDFGWLAPEDKYWEVLYADKNKNYENPWVGQLNPADGEDYVPGQVETEKEVGTNKVNSIHCFEFLDNAVEVCNFNNKYKAWIENPEKPGTLIPDPTAGTYTYEETWYNTFTNKDNKLVPGWTLGFESRYPEDRVGYHDADMLYPLASWLNELYNLRYGLNGVEVADEKQALERFKAEYECYLDKNFTLFYYLVTETLLMADSRVKNMMIATWGKEKRSYKDYHTGEIVETNNYIFYPIFYDMDTMMGLDNTGVYRFNYFDEDTNSSVYNGNCVLWNFVRDTLKNELDLFYTELEGSLLTVNTKNDEKDQSLGLLPFFNNNQANMANEAFYNSDAKYKYIDPAREGYHDDLNDKDISPGAGPFLYAAQGDRSLMREWFMTNRVKFLRGKHNSKKFKSGDRIEYRQYFPNGEENDFIDANGISHKETIAAVPPSNSFSLTSVKTGYAGVMIGANAAAAYVNRFDNQETKQIVVPEVANANGTEAYLLGLSNLSDLGDLSDKYMQKFIISSSEVRLKNLTLGNSHKNYYNPFWSTTVDGDSPKIDVSKAIYLENFNLQNCSTYKSGLDFSNCNGIQKILLTGSGVDSLKLPINGVVKELRLPTTVTDLTIDSLNLLTDDGFSLGTYNYDPNYNRIGEGNGSYVNDFSKLIQLTVINTPIDTYKIVSTAKSLERYCLEGFNWYIDSNDTQYCPRFNNNNLDMSKISTYYIYNMDSKNYELWGKDSYPIDGTVLYEKVTMLDENNNIKNIPVLDFLMTKSPENVSSPARALIGNIVINIPGAKVDELEIYKKYHSYYSELEISYGSDVEVIGAYRINFYRNDYNEINSENVNNLVPYFTNLTSNSTESLKDLIDNNNYTDPIKNSTNTQTFTFNKKWTDWNTKITYFQDETADGYVEERLFKNIYPNENMKLFPHYTVEERKYKVTFYDYDGKTELFSLFSPYEMTLSELLETDSKGFLGYYNYRPNSSDMGEHERYSLSGWSTVLYGENIDPVICDLNTYKITGDLNLYAYYEIEDARYKASNLNMFDIQSSSQSIAGYIVKGLAINFKASYKDIVRGKITLPSRDADENIIKIFGNFKNATNVIDIYFLPDAQYTHFSEESCLNLIKLKSVNQLPNTLTVIGGRAFENCQSLSTIEIDKCTNLTTISTQAFQVNISTGSLTLSKLPPNIVNIGSRAFMNGSKNLTISELPNSLVSIGTQCFMNQANVAVNVFGGPPGTSALKTVGAQAFQGTGKNSNATSITIYSPVRVDDSYGDSNGRVVYSVFNNAFVNNHITVNTWSLFDMSEEDFKMNLFGRTNGITIALLQEG